MNILVNCRRHLKLFLNTFYFNNLLPWQQEVCEHDIFRFHFGLKVEEKVIKLRPASILYHDTIVTKQINKPMPKIWKSSSKTMSFIFESIFNWWLFNKVVWQLSPLAYRHEIWDEEADKMSTSACSTTELCRLKYTRPLYTEN